MGPNIAGSANWPKIEQFGGLPIGPKWTKFKFFKNLLLKIQIERGQFYEKNANSCIFGPMLWAILDIWGSASFLNFFGPNPNLKGVNFMKKMAVISILGLILRAVLINRGSANWPRMDRF